MTRATAFSPITKWGRAYHDLLQREELPDYDIAEGGLQCAADLPGTDNELLSPCLAKIDDWATLVERYATFARPQFDRNPASFGNSEAQFSAIAMTDCLQRRVGIRYNYAFAEGEYDASDSRNLFVHGILTGFGGNVRLVSRSVLRDWSPSGLSHRPGGNERACVLPLG